MIKAACARPVAVVGRLSLAAQIQSQPRQASLPRFMEFEQVDEQEDRVLAVGAEPLEPVNDPKLLLHQNFGFVELALGLINKFR